MLLILYGAASELSRRCRDYLQEKGYEPVAKYGYAEDKPALTSRYGEREFLSREEFYARTDSLFRYRVANFQIGFNWGQISDAVYGGKNRLLTCASSDVKMLRKIKEVYGDKVHIVYCHVETAALEGLFVNLPESFAEMPEEEYGQRMAVGLAIKRRYAENADLFDSVVLYAGEGSSFNYRALYRQFDSIVEALAPAVEERDDSRYDVFLSFHVANISDRRGNDQYNFVKDVKDRLEQHGIRCFDEGRDLKAAHDFYDVIRHTILRSKVFLPVLTEDGANSSLFQEELRIAAEAANNSGLVILPVRLDEAPIPRILETRQCLAVSSDHYLGSLDFIEDWLVDMIGGEDTLKRLSEEIDACISTSLYPKAFELQGSYVNVLRNHLSRWHRKGTTEIVGALLRQLELAIPLRNADAGERIVSEILTEYAKEPDPNLCDRLGSALAAYGKSFRLREEEIAGKIENLQTIDRDMKKNLSEAFRIHFERMKADADRGLAKAEQRDRDSDRMADRSDQTELEDRIAAYSSASMELFEALFARGIAPGYRETLIAAYNRILDYCRDIRLGNDITEKCIDRVSELKAGTKETAAATESGRKTLRSLKVYLGQALPETGEYDVFLSHRSADDLLADKIYDYLKSCGLEVFCDHHTLGEMRDSEYDKRVTEALQHSKHLVLLASNPEYVKNRWVYYEWHQFFNEKREGYRKGNLILVLSDELLPRKMELPAELRDGIEIIKTSEFRERIMRYLW